MNESGDFPYLSFENEADFSRRDDEIWQTRHCRHYHIAGITIRIESEIPFSDNTFQQKFRHFKADRPGEDTVVWRYAFSLPKINGHDLGEMIRKRSPWEVYRQKDSFVYLGILPERLESRLWRVAVFKDDFSESRIYNEWETDFLNGESETLSFFPSDQIPLVPLLAKRNAFYLHSCGINMSGSGLLFAGHSDAGKSTTAAMLKRKGGEILCDDRIIVRQWPDGFKIHGTWSHGDLPDVSSASVPLKALMFIEQASENRLIRIENKGEIVKKLLAFMVRSAATADWWGTMLAVAENLVREIPCYRMLFDKSGDIVELLENL